MIITIKGADFSSANIGTLSTYIISKSIGTGASFDIPNFVDKNSSVNWVITLDEGYTFGTYSVTMGGVEVTPTVVDNVMTISIAEVTGNVRIVVATVNENTGEEDEPVVPPVGSDGDVLLLIEPYKAYKGAIEVSTNSFSITAVNTFYQIPLSDFNKPDSVTVIAGETKAYIAFFTEKIIKAYSSGQIPYAGTFTNQTIMEIRTTMTFDIPSNATHMYILKTNAAGDSLLPASVTFHNASYIGCSDPEHIEPVIINYFGTTWELGKTISNSGAEENQLTYAASDYIAIDNSRTIKYVPYIEDNMYFTVSTYKSNNEKDFIKRQVIDPTQKNEINITLDNEATHIRCGYGRSSTTNIVMTGNDMSKLNISWV